eukprot:scaffold47_cov258-Pinguiococcus_pyrenoidosus.AAC.27
MLLGLGRGISCPQALELLRSCISSARAMRCPRWAMPLVPSRGFPHSNRLLGSSAVVVASLASASMP